MDALFNIMLQRALMALKLRATTRVGQIMAYDPDTHCVKVELQPTGDITGWMPLGSQWVGNGWGLFLAPELGQTVEVEFQLGSLEAGMVCHRFFNNDNAPLSVSSGEAWLVHKTGAALKLKNDGSVEITAETGKLKIVANAGADITVNGDTTLTQTGNLTANVQGQVVATISDGMILNGNLTVNGVLLAGAISQVTVAGVTPDATFTHFITAPNAKINNVFLANHVHGGVQTGSGDTTTMHN